MVCLRWGGTLGVIAAAQAYTVVASNSSDKRPPKPLGGFVARLLQALCINGGYEMRVALSVITLGVDDLERAVRFYRDGLGLPTDGIVGEEFEFGAVAFFELQSGLRLALWPRDSISHDTGLIRGESSATEFTLGCNVATKVEVDALMDRAAQAGAKITKTASPTFWGGYSGYFQDPDQHIWEVVWNPEWMPGA